MVFGYFLLAAQKLPKATVAWWLELLIVDTRIIQPTASIDFPRGHKDAPFLICAEPGKADYLITGDTDFSEATALVSATICSLSQFAQRIAPSALNVLRH
ncbi:MAG: hypothetical protein CTY11_08120 [Methylomonas sp.]|nr:MAG: hypothetical protein CTY11_08120 [Methylomonas sp.]